MNNLIRSIWINPNRLIDTQIVLFAGPIKQGNQSAMVALMRQVTILYFLLTEKLLLKSIHRFSRNVTKLINPRAFINLFHEELVAFKTCE